MEHNAERKLIQASGRISRRRFLQLTGSVLLGLSAAACSDIEPDYTVAMVEGNSYLPSTLIVPVGAMVAFYNQHYHVHTATCDPESFPETRAVLPEGAEPWHSGDLREGETWVHIFDVPGTYIYICRFHYAENMFGQIQVV